MNLRNTGKSAFTLIELLVVVSIIALLIAILLPSLAKAREQSRRVKCGSNVKSIGTAYQMWAGDNSNFMPPRCSVNRGCTLSDPLAVGWKSQSQLLERQFHYDGPKGIHQDIFGTVGNPLLKASAADNPSAPTSYNRADSFPLNRYILPGWRVGGGEMEIAHCPSDRATIINSSPIDDVEAAPPNGLTSVYELVGTSYATNNISMGWWFGHGPWAKSVEGPFDKRSGPNYVAERIYTPSRYVVMIDVANFYENFFQLMGFDKAPSGRWHEHKAPARWITANALFADNHVALAKYDFPLSGMTQTNLDLYVNADWSLYPLKRKEGVFGGS